MHLNLTALLRPLLAGLALAGLGGCTYGMYDAMFGHGAQPTDTPEVMAADTHAIMDRVEAYCYSGKPVWRKTSSVTAECVWTARSAWAFLESRQGWFEAMTRGIGTFRQTLGERYSYSTSGHAEGGNSTRIAGKSTNYYAWAYLLGDGSTQLLLEREWDSVWNGPETAVVEEHARMRVSLRVRDECLAPQKAQMTAPCPHMQAALRTPPESLTEDDLARIASQSVEIGNFLAGVDRDKSERDGIRQQHEQRVAAEQQASRQAIERGIRQGLAGISVGAAPTAVASAGQRPASVAPSRVQLGGPYQQRLEQQARLLSARQQQAPATSVGARDSEAAAPVAASAGLGVPAAARVQTPGQSSSLPSAAATEGAATRAAAPTMASYQEAVVYCWMTGRQSGAPAASPTDERWICHGPVQRTWAPETLATALEQAGCKGVQEGRRWTFKEGTLYACGFGRESYDENVVERYGVPGEMQARLHTYRCAVPRNGRCDSRS